MCLFFLTQLPAVLILPFQFIMWTVYLFLPAHWEKEQTPFLVIFCSMVYWIVSLCGSSFSVQSLWSQFFPESSHSSFILHNGRIPFLFSFFLLSRFLPGLLHFVSSSIHPCSLERLLLHGVQCSGLLNHTHS